jgi:hypothetical protein
MSRIVEGPVGAAIIVVLCSIGIWPLAVFVTLFLDAPGYDDPWTYRLIVHIWTYPVYLLVALAIGVHLRLTKPEFRRGWGLVFLPVLLFLGLAVALGALSERYREADGLSAGEHEFLAACEAGDVMEIEAHLARGADPNLRSHTRRTPLGLAYRSGNFDAIRLLVERGADPDELAQHGLELLGEPRLLELLLQHGLGSNERVFGYLHEAIRRGHTEAVGLLVDHGATLYRDGAENGDALLLAVTLGRWDAALMIARRSDPRALSDARTYLRNESNPVDDSRRDAVVAFIDERLEPAQTGEAPVPSAGGETAD